MLKTVCDRWSSRAASRSLIMALAFLSMASTQVGALTIEEVAVLKGPDRQKTLLDGARAEGKVVLYSGMIVNQALRPLAAAFKAKYPFVNLEYWRESSSTILKKIIAERR